MRTYAAYLRKSRAEDAENLEEVLQRHRAKLLETSKRMEIEIVDWYEEIVSGESISARPKMQQLLNAVADEQYSAVFCMDIDRLGRGDMQDQGLILSTFRLSETKIITPDKIYDMQDETDETMTEFKAFFARQEYKMIRKRMRRGTLACIQEGGYIANAPYGYEQCRINKKPSLKIVPEEAEFVRLAYQRYTEGMGATSIASELNALGSVPRRNIKWTSNSIRYMLRNPVYTGMTVFNRKRHTKKGMHGADRNITRDNPKDKWLVAEGLHKPIITKEQFDLAQNIRQGKSTPSKQDGKIHNPFAGVLQCGVCGRNLMTIAAAKGGPYLACYTPGCCAMAKERYIEDYILSAMELEMQKLELPESDDGTDNVAAMKETIAALERELSRNEAKKPRLYEFLEDGIYSRDVFLQRMAVIDAESQRLTSRLQAEKDNLDTVCHLDKKRLHDAIRSTLELWEESDAPTKNMMLKSLISKATYYKEKKTKPKDFRIDISLRNF